MIVDLRFYTVELNYNKLNWRFKLVGKGPTFW